MTLEEARAAKEHVRQVLSSIQTYVVGLGVTRVGNGYGLKVNLRRTVPSDIQLPSKVDNVPIIFEVVGEIVKR